MFAGCSKTEKKSAKQQQTQNRWQPVPTALKQSNPKCVGPFTTSPAKDLEIAGVKYSQNGAVLNQVKSDEIRNHYWPFDGHQRRFFSYYR